MASGRTYAEEVELPDSFTVQELGALVNHLVGLGAEPWETKVLLRSTGGAKAKTFDEALSHLDDDEFEQIRWILSVLEQGDVDIWLDWWDLRDSKKVRVSGNDQPTVLGLAETIRRYVAKMERRRSRGGPMVPASRPVATAQQAMADPVEHSQAPAERTRPEKFRDWARDLSVEVMGGLLVLILAALGAALWAAFIR